MIWTKLKKLTEDLLADSLQGRVAYHLTRYGPGLSYLMTRGWITLDGREIVGCSTIRHVREVHRLTGEWYQRDPDVLRALHRESIFTRTEFIEALEACVSQPINLLLQSSQPLMRANALLDRGVGKRRLREMDFSLTEVPVIRDFYAIRCQAEGITQPGKLL